MQHNITNSSSTDKKIDNLVEQMKSLRFKLSSMEKRYEEACKAGKDTASGDGSATSVTLRVPTPQGVEVGLTTNREEREEAEVGLEEVSIPGEVASREKKRIMGERN